MVDRLSSTQIFDVLTGHVLQNQQRVLNVSKQINLGSRIVNSYDDPVSMVRSLQSRAKIDQNDQSIRGRQQLRSDLEFAETSIGSMKDILDRVKELAIFAGSDVVDSDARAASQLEIRSLGETIVQLANAKSGSRFIFSGTQTNLQTLTLSQDADFATAVFKEGVDSREERFINTEQSSINLFSALVAQASSASLTGKSINPVITTAGNLDIELDDGNSNVTSFSVALTIGDNLASVVGKINAAFTAAGGAGSIAQISPNGYLNLDTALVTGNTPGERAKIQIFASSDPTVVSELGVKEQIVEGKSEGIMRTLSRLEAAFSANDTVTIRSLLTNIDENIDTLIKTQASIGSLVSKADVLEDHEANLDIKLQADRSVIEDIDFVTATSELSAAQAALASSSQTTGSFFRTSIFNFLGS